MDFFSTGGRYRNNWASTFAGGINGSHHSKTEFFNFNPKWNSRYLDFLSSTGRAEVVTQGVITAKKRRTSAITVATGLFYEEQTVIPAASLNSKIPDGKEKLPGSVDLKLPHGNAQNTASSDSFRFEFSVAPVITAKASTLPIKVSGTSLLGWNSDGSPRLNVSSAELLHGRTVRFDIRLVPGIQAVSSGNGEPFAEGSSFCFFHDSKRRGKFCLKA